MQRLTVTPGGQTAASRVKFDLDLPSASADDRPLGPGRRLPEWDWRRRKMQPEHCAVQTLVAASAPAYRPPPALRATARRVRRRFEVLRAAPQWQRGCTSGDAIDLDAWVRHRIGAGDTAVSAAPAVYRQRTRGARSLATLLLADLSLSTDAYADSSARIVDVIREALYVFGEALAATGDAFEMLGFSSVRRQNVRLQHLKGFDEPWNATAQARVGAIRPGYYTRMGAALREATLRLAARPERQRLLLVLTDGKPNDLDVYEGRYGLEDTRHAVQAARDAGLTPFCVTIDEKAHDYLPHLFGSRGYALVRHPRELPTRLARVYAALTR
jgi:nitric oxide reductase NorD protein